MKKNKQKKQCYKLVHFICKRNKEKKKNLPIYYKVINFLCFKLKHSQLFFFFFISETTHTLWWAPLLTSCRAGSRGACADPLCAGSPWNKCHIRRVWSPCASCCGWWGWSSGWTLCRTLGTCAAFPLQRRAQSLWKELRIPFWQNWR